MRHFRIVVACMIAGYAAGQCPSSGLTLTTTGGRLGEPFTLSMTGTPGVTGLLGFDLAPGPVATPIGNVCLGLTPALQFQPFSLDATGSFGVAGTIPPGSGLPGINVFMQAGAADGTQLSGFAFSNGAVAAVRPPRVHLVLPSNGYIGPPPSAPPPGKWAPYDVLTDSLLTVVNLPALIAGEAIAPDLGWIALLLANNTIAIYDVTNTNVLTITLPPPLGPAWQSIAVYGSTMIVFAPGTAPTPGTIAAYSLPLGAPLWTLSVPPGGTLVTPRAATKAYVVNGPGVLPIDVGLGIPLTPFLTGPFGSYVSGWTFGNGFLYFLVAGATGLAINGIDDILQTTVHPAAQPLPVPGGLATLVAAGPGTNGPSVFVRDWTTSTLLQLSAAPLVVSAPPVPIPAGLSQMELSNGGSEWLMLCNPAPNGGASIKVMNPGTLSIVTAGTIPGGFGVTLRIVPSATMNKAYVRTSAPALIPFSTDPTTGPLPTMPPLPLWGFELQALVD